MQARELVSGVVPDESVDAYLKVMTNLAEFNRRFPKYIAINCWHMNEHESAAMWKLYLKGDEGIAVQSTYNKLRASIIDDEEVFLGVVRYIDYETEAINAGNLLSPFVHKRKSFEHEREVRAVVIKWPICDGGMDFNQEAIGHGLKIKMNVKVLVERIYIAPSAPEWFADLVRALIQRYGYNFDVEHSKLSERPVF